jgi:hypothetical protein
MLFGCALRPIIVCPERLWQSLSADDRKAFLAHESAHYCRRDHWVRWLEWFVSTVYWWFPGVYFGQKQLERHEEACCDAWAVKALETKPRCYAETLLRVVDFISDHEVGLPRFASGMQPTETLEERLRLLMRNELDHSSSPLHSWGSGLACAAIWMVHPDAYPIEWARDVSPVRERVLADPLLLPVPAIVSDEDTEAVLESSLPAVPRGFWNASPVTNWAGFSFDVSGYQLTAVAGKGFVIDRSTGQRLEFDERGLTCIAEIPASGRVIIGDADGSVRLWDLDAGMPVSLLGRHPAGVTSLAIGPDGGVFSADSSGSVIRWEMQSGQTLARWDAGGREGRASDASLTVQSIRVSRDGSRIAVVCGDWRQTTTQKTLFLLNGKSLALASRQAIHCDTAIVLQDEQLRWCAVGWSGVVRSVDSSLPIGTIEKHRVSALLLSQHAALRTETAVELPELQGPEAF